MIITSPARPAGPVRVGPAAVGGPALTVLAGPEHAGDVAHVSLRRHHGRADAAAVLVAARALTPAPLLVEPFGAADLPAVARLADGVVVGAEWMQDFRLVSAVGRLGLPVVVQRGQHSTVEEWLASVQYLEAEGCTAVVLCETGTRTHLGARPRLDLALVADVRERAGRPVLVDVSAAPGVAAAAVGAGADGLWLAEDAPAGDVLAAREATTTLAPLVRRVAPRTLADCRAAIDRVDAALAMLLDQRAALAATVQRLKPVGGHAGRDARREAQIVDAVAGRAPHLTHDGVRRIMTAVIEAGLDAATPARP